MQTTCPTWWCVIEALAEFVAMGYDYDDLESPQTFTLLEDLGFMQSEIENALDWLELASLSGNVADVFSMLQPSSVGTRIPSAHEKNIIPAHFWRKFQNLRQAGIIGEDVLEGVIESLRHSDVLEWGETEFADFLNELISANFPHKNAEFISKVSSLNDKLPEEFYS